MSQCTTPEVAHRDMNAPIARSTDIGLWGPNPHSFSRVPAVTGEFDDLLAAETSATR